MATIQEDIVTFSGMIVQALSSEDLNLNYTLSSTKDIDTFYDKHSVDGVPIKDGSMVNNLGQILFAIGSYIGETIIRIVPEAVWVIDEEDPEGEINVQIKLPNGALVCPVQRAIKRFRNGPEDSIYVYVYHIVQPYVDVERLLKSEPTVELKKKRWWHF